MNKIKFTSEEKNAIVTKIKRYMSEELDHDLGSFEAEFLLDFFTDEIGPYFYNRGIYDAQNVVNERLESVTEALYTLEQTTPS